MQSGYCRKTDTLVVVISEQRGESLHQRRAIQKYATVEKLKRVLSEDLRPKPLPATELQLVQFRHRFLYNNSHGYHFR